MNALAAIIVERKAVSTMLLLLILLCVVIFFVSAHYENTFFGVVSFLWLCLLLGRLYEERLNATDSTPIDATDSTPADATDSTPCIPPNYGEDSGVVSAARKTNEMAHELLLRVIEFRVRAVCPEAYPVFPELHLDAGVSSEPSEPF